ncbi:Ty1/Copia family ribonuclease HI, partial [Klebsiella pneumoniae]|uniref:Ty1/Copia family ribonuclease HI n=1 Tax=Klebsiella pneumoniae TaxID=573 RepID=UPI0040555B47
GNSLLFNSLLGFMYESNSNNLVCFSDADWAGDDIDRKSVSGCIVLHCGNPISWFSRKQSCVALSTMEAEYIASSISGRTVQ